MASDLISPNDPARLAAEQFSVYLNLDVPPRFSARIDVPPAVDQWVSDGGSLYLTGGVGTGKTHTAFEALRRLREARRAPQATGNLEPWQTPDNRGRPFASEAEVWRATTLLDALRPGNDDARDTVSVCQRAGLLLLDDLGAEKSSEWTQERIYEVIDERYVWERPTIITSNVPPRALAEWVGDRVASRLAEMCTVVALTGQDRRRS